MTQRIWRGATPAVRIADWYWLQQTATMNSGTHVSGARWFMKDDGRLRLWDGSRWTDHHYDQHRLSPGEFTLRDGTTTLLGDGQAWRNFPLSTAWLCRAWVE